MKTLCLLSALFLTGFAASGCYTIYCDSTQTIQVDSTPSDAFVWDASGKRLLGKTPLTLTVASGDWRTTTLYLTKNGFHSTDVQIVDTEAGNGYLILDGLLIIPVICDSILMETNNFCGKFCGTHFNVQMIPENVPLPKVPDPPRTVYVPVPDHRTRPWWDARHPDWNRPHSHDDGHKTAPPPKNSQPPPKAK